MIPRSLSGELKDYLAFYPAVGLIGARQTGKTTLALALAQDLGGKIRYFDLERLEHYQKLKADARFFLEQYQEELVIIDEVQRMPGLFAELRSLIDRHRVPGRFLLLGSASPLLMQHTADSLAGRIGYLTLFPLSYREMDLDSSRLLTHWWRGGFPDAWMAPTDPLSVQWREDFIRTYVERDLQTLGLTTDPVRFRTFLQMLAAVHGQLWNAESLGRSIGVSGNTIRNYLGFLERSFFITILHPFYKNIGKRLVKSPKIYVQDTGLLHILLGIRNQEALLLHPHAGASWEGYVIMEILRQLPKGLQAHFFRTADGTECDLLLTRGLEPVVCLEIRLGQVPRPTKGFYKSIELMGTKHNYLITWSGDTYAIGNNVMVTAFDTFVKSLRDMSMHWS